MMDILSFDWRPLHLTSDATNVWSGDSCVMIILCLGPSRKPYLDKTPSRVNSSSSWQMLWSSNVVSRFVMSPRKKRNLVGCLPESLLEVVSVSLLTLIFVCRRPFVVPLSSNETRNTVKRLHVSYEHNLLDKRLHGNQLHPKWDIRKRRTDDDTVGCCSWVCPDSSLFLSIFSHVKLPPAAVIPSLGFVRNRQEFSQLRLIQTSFLAQQKRQSKK